MTNSGYGAQLHDRNRSMTRTVFGLIERDLQGGYQGRIVGFEHIVCTGASAAVVERKLRELAADLIAHETLVLESYFDSVVPIGVVL